MKINKPFTKTLIKNIMENDVLSSAAQAAYYLTLSMPPLIILALSVFKNTHITDSAFSLFYYIFPENVSELLGEALEGVAHSYRLTVISALGVFFSASGGVWALMQGICKAHTNVSAKFSVKKRLFACFFTILFMLAIVATLSLLVIGGLADLAQNDLFTFGMGYEIIGRVVSCAVVYAFVHMLYKVSPNVDIDGKELFFGALFASLFWIVLSATFELYITYFTKYTTVYKGIGAFMALLLWLYVISLAIIVGAEINAVLLEIKGRDKSAG